MTIHIRLVTSEACHYCDDAKEIISRLQQHYPIEVEQVPTYSSLGCELMFQHGILFPPGIFLNGEFFSYGRLSEKKLTARLASLTNQQSVSGGSS